MSSHVLNEAENSKRRVFIIDDHPIIRDGLTQLINREPDLGVCGVAAEAQSGLAGIESLKPDLLVIDISLNGPDGLDVLKTVRARDLHLPVLILSMYDESIYAERALRAGANGYIMKQEATEKVLVAMRRILNDREIYVSERLANKMLRQYVQAPSPPTRSPLDDLSDRELQVLRSIGDGHSTREIAEALYLSVKTIESYQSHLKDKLGLKNARELLQYAIELALRKHPGTVQISQGK